MTGFLEKSKGNKSMMRLILLLATIISGGVAIWGMVLLTMAVKAVISEVPSASGIIGTLGLLVGGALGVIAGGQGFKALQQRGEVKENITGNTHG